MDESVGTVEVGQSLDDHMAAKAVAQAPIVRTEPVDAPSTEETHPDGAPESSKEADGQPKDERGRFKAKELRENPVARMKQATADAATAKRERDEARAEATRLREEFQSRQGQRQEPERAPEPKAEAGPKRFQADPPPDIRNFNDWESYQRALAADAAREEWHSLEAKKQETERQKAHRDGMERTFKAAQAQIDEAGGQEFLDTLAPAVLQLDPIRTHLGALIAQSEENVVGLMKYMSDNPDEFQLLQTLPPSLLIRKIGRIEERLSGAAVTATAPRVEVSKAGPPVRPVTGKSAPHTPDLSNASLDQHMAAMSRKKRA